MKNKLNPAVVGGVVAVAILIAAVLLLKGLFAEPASPGNGMPLPSAAETAKMHSSGPPLPHDIGKN